VFSYYRRGRLGDTAAALEQPPSPLASQDPGSRIRQAGAGSEGGAGGGGGGGGEEEGNEKKKLTQRSRRTPNVTVLRWCRRRGDAGAHGVPDRCSSTLVLEAFRQVLVNANALPRITVGTAVWGESGIMSGVY